MFVISSLSAGGAERVLSLLANRLVETHEIVIATMAETEPFYPLHKDVCHIKLNLMKESGNTMQSVANSIRRVKTLVEVFKRENPDIIISFMTHMNILATIAAKISGKRIIVSERIAHDYYGSKILNIARRAVYPLSDALVTQTYADLENYSFLKRACVIYNPVLTDNHTSNVKKEKIVLGVGRLEEQKGFDVLIETFHKIGKPDWRLVIIGEGAERERLEGLIDRLGARNIELPGRTKEIFDWYRRASIFVLSSKREGFPNVLIEAMSMGCPVIAFDCPYGPGEIIKDGKNGILVEDQNEKALEEAMRRMIETPAIREKLSHEATKVQEQYSIDKILSEWKEVVVKVLNA